MALAVEVQKVEMQRMVFEELGGNLLSYVQTTNQVSCLRTMRGTSTGPNTSTHDTISCGNALKGDLLQVQSIVSSDKINGHFQLEDTAT